MGNYDGLIITFNEAVSIRRTIQSLQEVCDTVFVLDSYSTDETVQIAKDLGAVVKQRAFDDYASQRNYALKHFDFQNDIILFFDADERLSPELSKELKELDPNPNVDVLLVRRHDIIWDKIIRHASGYPTWAIRGMRWRNVSFERAINEGVAYDNDAHYLQGHFLHYPMEKGIKWWMERHIKYAKMEAYEIFTGKYKIGKKDLAVLDPLVRRLLVKKIVYNLPGRPFLVFLIFYFIKRGFLDGKAGFTFALMRFYYECCISIQLLDFRLSKK